MDTPTLVEVDRNTMDIIFKDTVILWVSTTAHVAITFVSNYQLLSLIQLRGCGRRFQSGSRDLLLPASWRWLWKSLNSNQDAEETKTQGMVYFRVIQCGQRVSVCPWPYRVNFLVHRTELWTLLILRACWVVSFPPPPTPHTVPLSHLRIGLSSLDMPVSQSRTLPELAGNGFTCKFPLQTPDYAQYI